MANSKELTDPLHREALQTYVRWLNGWAMAQGDDSFVAFKDFDVKVLHDTGPDWAERSVTMRVDYGDDGGPQFLWVYGLMVHGGPILESLVQGFDTYVSVVVNSGEFQSTWEA